MFGATMPPVCAETTRAISLVFLELFPRNRLRQPEPKTVSPDVPKALWDTLSKEPCNNGSERRGLVARVAGAFRFAMTT
jgi:hypothetical protein